MRKNKKKNVKKGPMPKNQKHIVKSSSIDARKPLPDRVKPQKGLGFNSKERRGRRSILSVLTLSYKRTKLKKTVASFNELLFI